MVLWLHLGSRTKEERKHTCKRAEKCTRTRTKNSTLTIARIATPSSYDGDVFVAEDIFG
jgi:hypothetical protein